MSQFHTFHIKVDPSPHKCEITMDGEKLKGVRRVSFELTANAVPVLHLEIYGEALVEGEFREVDMVKVSTEGGASA